jgi:thioredoxin reductase (NADPH)
MTRPVMMAVDEDPDALNPVRHELEKPLPWPLERPPLMSEASIPGVFAAGDVRHGSVKRVASAVGEGATALQACHTYFEVSA